MKRDIPIVVVDRELIHSPWTQVVTNNYEVAKSTTSHFMAAGYTHVVVLTSKISMASTREERYAGIKAAASHVDVLEVSEESYNHTQVHQKLVKLITETTEKNLSVRPQRALVTGIYSKPYCPSYIDHDQATATAFSDTSTARNIEPRLQLISQDPYLMGASAAEVLVDQLVSHRRPTQDKIIIPATLR